MTETQQQQVDYEAIVKKAFKVKEETIGTEFHVKVEDEQFHKKLSDFPRTGRATMADVRKAVYHQIWLHKIVNHL
jgi:hypothetical protein